MEHQREFVAGKMFLVTDEQIEIKSSKMGNRPHDGFVYRLRIWRGKDAPAVVVASQIISEEYLGPPPSYSSSKIANYAQQVYLRWPHTGAAFFENEGEYHIWRMSFTIVGLGMRSFATNPYRTRAHWADVQALIGDNTAQP